MADQGKASRQVVQNLIDDIKDYIEVVEEELTQINREADALSADWQDKQYEEFMNYVDDLTSSLRRDLDDLENVKRNLEKALAIYD